MYFCRHSEVSYVDIFEKFVLNDFVYQNFYTNKLIVKGHIKLQESNAVGSVLNSRFTGKSFLKLQNHIKITNFTLHCKEASD